MALIGSGQITLVDLTDNPSYSLFLSTNLSKIQTYDGTTYNPDYTTSPLEITPFVYQGSTPIRTFTIKYYINKTEVEETNTEAEIYIKDSILYYKKNLTPSGVLIKASVIEINGVALDNNTPYAEEEIELTQLKSGAAGAAARNVYIEAPDQVITSEEMETEEATRNLIAHSVAFNNPIFEWEQDGVPITNGKEGYSISENGETSTLTFPLTSLQPNTVFKCTVKEDNTDISMYDIVTIVLDGTDGEQGPQGTPGEDAYTIVLDNEFQQVACDSKYQVIKETTISTSVKVYKGGELITEGIEVSCTEIDSENEFPILSTSMTFEKTLNPGDILLNARFWNFEITVNGSLFIKQFSYAPSVMGKDGENGESVYFARIDSDRDVFSNTQSDPITLTARLFYGNTEIEEDGLSFKWTRQPNDFPENGNPTEKTLTISRDSINGTETFTCEIIYNETSYSANITLRDQTDPIYSEIIASTEKVVNNSGEEVTLECKIYEGTKLLNPDESNNDENIHYKWFYSLPNVEEEEILDGENSIDSKSLTIKPSERQTNGVITYWCTAYYLTEEGSEKWETTSNVSIQVVRDLFLEINPQIIFIPLSENGNFEDGEYVQDLEITAFYGNDSTPSEISIGLSSNINGISFSKTDRKITFTQSFINGSWSAKSIPLTFKITVDEVEYTRIIYITKGRSDSSGTGYTVSLSNDFHMFAGADNSAAVEEVETEVFCFSNTTKIDIEKITLGASNGTRLSTTEISYFGFMIKVDKEDNPKKIIIKSTTSLSQKGSLDFYIHLADSGLIFLKTFSYDINFNGSSYFMEIEPTILKLNEEGNIVPNQINIYRRMRSYNTNKVTDYTNGRLTLSYSTDGSVYNPIKTSINGNIEQFLTQYNNALFFKAVLTNSSNEILDSQTIPVIADGQDGKDGASAQIGGENLIRWSKTLPIATNKWSKTTNGTIETDGSFSTMNFGSSASFTSPLIDYEKEYKEKTFCLSAYVQNKSNNNQTIGVSIGGVSANLNAPPTGENNWEKTFVIFSLTNTTNDFTVKFSNSSSNVSLKKPKLEIGEVATEWSPSIYDISYEDLAGNNLISNSLNFSVGTDWITLTDSLETNTDYTLSWENIDDTTVQIFTSFNRTTSYNVNSPYTFNSGSNESLYIKSDIAGTIINKIKLEKGKIATSYTLTDEQVSALIQQMTKEANDSLGRITNTFYDENGNPIIVTPSELDEFKKTLEEQNGKINKNAEELEAQLTQYADIQGNLQKIQSAIKIGVENSEGELAIVLSTDAGNQGSSKLEITSSSLNFISNDQKIAFIDGSKLKITHAEINNSLQIGNVKFIPTSTGTALIYVSTNN